MAEGDPAAVRACIARFGNLVWSMARRLSPTREDAEDAVQEIFLDLWKSAARYDAGTASEEAFVATIARRRLIDRGRRRGRRLDTEELPDVVAEAPRTPSAEVHAEVALAARAVERLRPEQRDVLLLSACEGMSHDEIATSTGMPLGTVKAHARRGMIRVRDLLFAGEGAAANEGRFSA